MLPLPPIRTDMTVPSRPVSSRVQAAGGGTGSYRCISSLLPVSSAWGERIHSFLGSELHIFLHILGHA